MKLFRMIGRSFRDGFKSVFRNFYLSVGSITSITITLLIVAVTIMASMNVNNFTKVIEKDVTMVVFLEIDTTNQEIAKLEEGIKNIDNVDTVTFKSKTTTKEEFQQNSDIFKEIMADWDEDDNPLKDSFLVTVKDITKIKDTDQNIKRLSNIAATNYGEGMVQKLIGTFNIVEKVSYGVLIVLSFVTIMLIINTIKLTIFSRQREIKIMRLVGASNITIRQPFIVEGVILGLLGSIIPILVTVYGYYGLYNSLNGELFSSLFKLIRPEPFIFHVSLLLAGLGMFVGMLGSSRAVRKYLKIWWRKIYIKFWGYFLLQ